MQKQLWQLVADYQNDGDLPKLLLESYELLRYHKGYGSAAMACKTVAEILLDPENARPVCGLEGAKEALENGSCHRAVQGDSHGLPTRRFGFQMSGLVGANVTLIFGWSGSNMLYAQRGMYLDADDLIEPETWGIDYVEPKNVPFDALVYAILLLAETALPQKIEA